METIDKTLVTGASGFIGTHLVKSLLAQGSSVRAMTRVARLRMPIGLESDGDNVFDSDRLEIVSGDVTDRDSVFKATEGCTHVFHLAGYAKIWARDPKIFHDVNVIGARNVCDAAAAAGVRRLVLTSTMLTLGPTARGEIGTEDTPRSSDRFLTEYEKTKTQGEREAIQRAGEGLPIVIVNPTRTYGPGHLSESNTLAIFMKDYLRGKMPFMINRGVNIGNYATIDDVVEGHILAMQHGRIGERYLLGGENASLKEVALLIDEISGKRHFRLPLLSYGPMLFAMVQKKRAEWFNIYPSITPEWIRVITVDWAFSSEKAQRELGYQTTPLAEGLRETYRWLQRIDGDV